LSGSIHISVGDSNNGASLTLSVSFSNSGDFSATVTGTGKIAGITAGSVSGTLHESGRLGLDFYALGVYLGHLDFSLSSSGSTLMGPVAGATVFFDANGNLTLDAGEPSTITDEFGDYLLPDGWEAAFDRNGNGVIDDNEGYLVAFGGVDTTTGLPLTGVLKTFAGTFTPDMPLILSPLSTVTTYLVESLGSRTAANTALANALGVPLMLGMDFATFDPFSAALAGPAEGGGFYAGSVQFGSIATDINAYLNGAASGVNSAALTASVYQSIASEIAAAPGARINLGADTLVRRVIDKTITSLGLAAPPEIATAATIIANAAHQIELKASGGDVNTIITVKGTVQGPIAKTLTGLGAGSISGNTALSQTVGSGFDTLLGSVTVPGIPAGYEFPAPQVQVQTLPDGSQNMTVIAQTSEPVLDDLGNSIPNAFEITAPLFGNADVDVTQVTVEASINEGGPSFLEIRSSLDNYQTVVARIATHTGSGTYNVALNTPKSTDPITLRIIGVGASNPNAAIQFTRVTVNAVLTPIKQVPAGLIEDPWDDGKLALKVVGTNESDNIQIVQKGHSLTIKVMINGVLMGEYQPTGHIVVYGLDGDDKIQISGDIDLPVILIGGEGNDTLNAGDSAAILLGGNGNDTLSNGKGRSILVGGEGEDRLSGGGNQDILITGSVNANLDIFVEVFNTWIRTDLTYAERVRQLGGPLGISDLDIEDDLARDKANGGSGKDWVLAGIDDKVSGHPKKHLHRRHGCFN
jgi:hypothetical protein